jgi:glycosyltransferase involved in cell wall biosynthesis
VASRKQTVALVTDAIFPYHRGGKEVRYREIAHRLTGHADVHVYTMKWWPGARDHTEGDVTFHGFAPYLPLYSGERRSIRQALVFAASCLRMLTKRFDVLEADHMPYFQLFPLRLVATLRRKRFVVTWHEHWGPDYWREYLGAPGVVGWWFERAAMRLPDAIIAASAETAERLREHVGDRVPVTVAPNGVDLDLVEEAPAAVDRTDLVVVGRMLEHKRIDMLLDAVALLRADGHAVTCRVIGDGPEREALHAQAAELGIADAVDFRHDVDDQPDLYGLLKAGSVFAFPSEREGFGIAVLEALACGLPVVTTAAPDNLAQHLIAGSDRGLVSAPDASSFAAALLSALEERDALGPDGPGFSDARDAWLRGFDWNSITDRVAEAMLR